jgi:hypothetical protein
MHHGDALSAKVCRRQTAHDGEKPFWIQGGAGESPAPFSRNTESELEEAGASDLGLEGHALGAARNPAIFSFAGIPAQRERYFLS